MAKESRRTIEVQGKSRISCKPDTIIISFELSYSHDDYSKAYDTLNRHVATLKKELEKTGLKREQVKTGHFNISVQKKLVKNEYVFDGYRAVHSFNIEFPLDKERINIVLNTITRSESLSDISIYFSVSNATEYRDRAISSAVLRARHNAENICKAANVALGPIENIRYGWSEIVFREESAEMCFQRSSECSTSMDIEAKDINIEESVYIVFAVS
jgi:hypothetical protein